MNAVDTSVVVPALTQWHEAHDQARQAAWGAAIPAHALVESYAVLTRLPAPHRVEAEVAARLLGAWFPPERILHAPPGLLERFLSLAVDAGISGGATYDALVGLTAAEHGMGLTTRDRRAGGNYRHLGIRYRLLGAGST